MPQVTSNKLLGDGSAFKSPAMKTNADGVGSMANLTATTAPTLNNLNHLNNGPQKIIQ